MKTVKMSIRPVAAIILLIAVSFHATAQNTKGNKNVVSEERTVGAFEGINAGSVFEIYLTQQETRSLIIETDENLLDKISSEVKNGVLHLDTQRIKDPTKLKAYISSPTINSINISGAASVSGENTIKTETLYAIRENIRRIRPDH